MNNQFEETLYDAHKHVFSIEEVYFESKSEHQHIIIFHNSKFGRIMALDGVIPAPVIAAEVERREQEAAASPFQARP